MRTVAALVCLLSLDPTRGADPAPAAADRPIRIGSKSFTESVILGEMLTQLVRSTGSRAEHRAELGGTQILWKALLTGEIDVYPEYTGTLLQSIFEGKSLGSDASLKQATLQHKIVMSGRLGFNNTYALGMRRERAAELAIRSLSDLARHPRIGELRFGVSDEFINRKDGWPGLKQAYNLAPGSIRGMNHDLAYRGLADKRLDVTDLYTTDAEIDYYNLLTLEDDKTYFPSYFAVLLYRADLAERAPAALAACLRLENAIDARTMISLNEQAKIGKKPETAAAADFLQAKLGIAAPKEDEGSLLYWRRLASRIWTTTCEHLYLVGLSLAAAIFTAVPLGVAAHRSPAFGKTALNIVAVIQTIPSMAVLVFMIPLLGLGAKPAIVALFLYSLLPIMRGTYTGLREIPASLMESAAALGLPSSARLRLVELPLAAPNILAGIKTAAVINVGTATIGALIGAGGYGQPILTGIRLDRLSLILEGAVPAALLAVAVQSGFDFAERFLVPAGLRLQKE